MPKLRLLVSQLRWNRFSLCQKKKKKHTNSHKINTNNQNLSQKKKKKKNQKLSYMHVCMNVRE